MDADGFLSKTISILATSPDFRDTLENLGRLATSHLADWYAVFVFENDEAMRRLVVVQNGTEAEDSTFLEAQYPLNRHATAGPGHVLRTGEHQLIVGVTDELAESLGLKPDELVIAGGRKPSRYLCVPITARGRVIGAMALMSAESGRLDSEADLALARDLASAAAVAMDNAKLCSEAQEANRLKDKFIAMVSHELRTPLTPILGCIHLLRTAKLNETNFARVIEMIERNAQTQVQIVEDLLDVSRIVAGRLHIAVKPSQLIPIAEAAVEAVRPAAEAKGVQIVTSFENVQQPMNADPDRLRQVIWNLLSNAVKFTPPDGRIEISIRRAHEFVQIQVTDTGAGIPADVLPFIFDRFRQAGDINPNVRSGLGLGLAIVRHVVALHNGTVDAASAGPGQGAVFTLKFPLPVAKPACASGRRDS